jgi:hypothetical protein
MPSAGPTQFNHIENVGLAFALRRALLTLQFKHGASGWQDLSPVLARLQGTTHLGKHIRNQVQRLTCAHALELNVDAMVGVFKNDDKFAALCVTMLMGTLPESVYPQQFDIDVYLKIVTACSEKCPELEVQTKWFDVPKALLMQRKLKKSLILHLDCAIRNADSSLSPLPPVKFDLAKKGVGVKSKKSADRDVPDFDGDAPDSFDAHAFGTLQTLSKYQEKESAQFADRANDTFDCLLMAAAKLKTEEAVQRLAEYLLSIATTEKDHAIWIHKINRRASELEDDADGAQMVVMLSIAKQVKRFLASTIDVVAPAPDVDADLLKKLKTALHSAISNLDKAAVVRMLLHSRMAAVLKGPPMAWLKKRMVEAINQPGRTPTFEFWSETVQALAEVGIKAHASPPQKPRPPYKKVLKPQKEQRQETMRNIDQQLVETSPLPTELAARTVETQRKRKGKLSDPGQAIELTVSAVCLAVCLVLACHLHVC